jgi:hypothetical protein
MARHVLAGALRCRRSSVSAAAGRRKPPADDNGTRHVGMRSANSHCRCHWPRWIGENPLFVLRLLGHSSTKMLFERYALFVANALADDGSRLERMMDWVAAG